MLLPIHQISCETFCMKPLLFLPKSYCKCSLPASIFMGRMGSFIQLPHIRLHFCSLQCSALCFTGMSGFLSRNITLHLASTCWLQTSLLRSSGHSANTDLSPCTHLRHLQNPRDDLTHAWLQVIDEDEGCHSTLPGTRTNSAGVYELLGTLYPQKTTPVSELKSYQRVICQPNQKDKNRPVGRAHPT